MKTNYLLSLLAFLLFASDSFAQPINEDCANATLIAPSISPACNTVAGTFSGSIQNTITCETGNHQDVWYQFVANEEINRISLSSSSGLDHGFEVIDGTCGGTSMFCVDNNGSSISEAYTSDQYLIGNTYYIRVFNSFTNLATQNFTICIESYPPPANDDCNNAVIITPSISPACISVAGTFSGASLNSIPCESGNHQDIWYQFVATEEINKISLSSSSGLDHGFEVIDGSCAGTSMFCVDNNGSSTSEAYTSDQYVIGNTYYIRVFNSFTNLISQSFTICIESYPPPANDDCNNAVIITPSISPACITVAGTFSGASLNSIPCESGNHQDIWYQFVATEEINKISLSSSSGLDHGFEVIDGSCAGTSMFCVDNNGSSTSEAYTSDQYVIGNTYYIRVFNSFTNLISQSFTICIESYPPPANDDCNNAVIITPSISPACITVAGTFSGASLNSIPCESGNHQDIWYQFVATEEINKISLSSSSGLDHGFEVIDGSCAGTSMFCVDNNGSSTSEAYTSDQYVIGNTYYIRVFNSFTNLISQSFTICIESYPPPANDDCSNAVIITPSISPACNSVPATFSGASLGTITCEIGDHQDIWYQFVATATTNNISLSPSSGLDHGFEVIDGSCTGTSMFCVDNNGFSISEAFTSGQYIIGNTYFIRVFNSSTNLNSSSFSICIESFPVSVNDDCTNAISITPSVSPACNALTGSFSGSVLGTIQCETGNHQDVWYQFVATATTNRVSLSATNSLDHGFEIIDGSCTGTSMFCVDNNGLSISEAYTSDQYIIGNTYYIRVFNSSTNISSQDFDICVESYPPPTNDDCGNAMSITPSVSPACISVPATFSGASLGSITCELGDHQDVWFEFVATSEVNRVSLSATSSLDHGFEVIDGSCTGTSMFCVDNNGTSISESFTTGQYVVGNTYYIRVFNSLNNLSSLNFDICVESFPAPSNDDCAAAISLTSSLTCTYTTGSFLGASQNATPCESGVHQDVWYSFIATNDTMYVKLDAANDLDHGFEVLDGCNGVSLNCTNNNGPSLLEEDEITNLTVGNTYYVRVYNASSGISENSFDICVFGDEDNTGITENEFGVGFLFYPNPTNGYLSIDLGQNHQNVTINLLDLNGKLLQSNVHGEGQLFKLKLEVAAGVYLLEIESEGEKMVIRLLKE